MWEDILALPEVESKVYKHGKQWGTNFHRDLVANILFQGQHLNWNHFLAFLLIICAVYLVFME